MQRWLVRGAVVYAGGVTAAYFLFKSRRQAPVADFSAAITETQRRLIFDANAAKYDDDIHVHERLSGILGLRETAAGSAHGLVLEVGAGTGRNLPYYPYGARVVNMDFSAAMLGVAKDRARNLGYRLQPLLEMMPAKSVRPVSELADLTSPEDANRSPADAKRIAALVSANASMGLPFQDCTFDAVVDTFGLCSYEDPVAVLREMRRVLKPGGRILLVEHGKSHWQWLSSLLDKNTPGHVHQHGCYWNRDIDGLVREAGLSVRQSRRKHLGTTYALVAE
jgi:methyltransferase OMS1